MNNIFRNIFSTLTKYQVVSKFRQDQKRDDRGRFAEEAGSSVTPGSDTTKMPTRTPEFRQWFSGSKVVDDSGEPLKVYHGSRADFSVFNTDPKDRHSLFARLVGAHFAVDPAVPNAFTAGTYAFASDQNISDNPDGNWYRENGELKFDGIPVVTKRNEQGRDVPVDVYDPSKYGSTWGFQKNNPGMNLRMLIPGGTVYPVYLSIKNPLVVKDPGDGSMDDHEVTRAVARVVLPHRRDLFVKGMESSGFMPEQSGKIWDALAAGKPDPVEHYESWEDLIQNRGVGLFDNCAAEVKAELMKRGYDGITYENTSKNELQGGSSKTWIAFKPSQIKSVFNPKPTSDPDISKANPNHDERGRFTTGGGQTQTSEAGSSGADKMPPPVGGAVELASRLEFVNQIPLHHLALVSDVAIETQEHGFGGTAKGSRISLMPDYTPRVFAHEVAHVVFNGLPKREKAHMEDAMIATPLFKAINSQTKYGERTGYDPTRMASEAFCEYYAAHATGMTKYGAIPKEVRSMFDAGISKSREQLEADFAVFEKETKRVYRELFGKSWDESAHPREPKGSEKGGEFAHDANSQVNYPAFEGHPEDPNYRDSSGWGLKLGAAERMTQMKKLAKTPKGFLGGELPCELLAAQGKLPEAVESFKRSWADSASGPMAAMVQSVIAEQHGGAVWSRGLPVMELSQHMRVVVDALRADVKKSLADLPEEITVYRGVHSNVASRNALESWSVSKELAARFDGAGILKATIPKSAVLMDLRSVSEYERELVVIGGMVQNIEHLPSEKSKYGSAGYDPLAKVKTAYVGDIKIISPESLSDMRELQRMSDMGQVDIGHEYATSACPTEEIQKRDASKLSASCVMAMLEPADAVDFLEFGSEIPDAELYTERGTKDSYGPDFGRETEVHCTVRYGQQLGVTADDVRKITDKFEPFSIGCGKVAKFDDPEKGYAVLIVPCWSGVLRKMNRRLGSLPSIESEYKTYTSHITLCYIKKQFADKYVGSKRFSGRHFKIRTMCFSHPEHGKVEILLGRSKTEDVEKAFDPSQPRDEHGRWTGGGGIHVPDGGWPLVQDKKRLGFLDAGGKKDVAGHKKATEMRNRLLSLGGVAARIDRDDPDLKKVLERGELWAVGNGKKVKEVDGEPSHCHWNAARRWMEAKDKVEIVTGYALDDDGLWTPHSWTESTNGQQVQDASFGRRRVAYYGVALSPTESAAFCKMLGVSD